ncbi:TIGR01620 family protein [Ciceribacter sp. L1K22]|uniref:YcjF family protein n=1 Tax=Ciceribacter sp. L1K22 TaxID=2820275 RepID=UPI001ABE0A50|nr:TIGR01620 family protein [Ciceribacter sp. L1K22]MBO3760664.1 TIGR01620 family protein [Ciceribacter sp. L1K22]
MTPTSKTPNAGRRPASFTVKDDTAPPETKQLPRTPRSFDAPVAVVVPDEEDVFLAESLSADMTTADAIALPRRRRFSFLKLAMSAFGVLVSLALGLWVDGLVRDLFARADWLGYTALAVLTIGLSATLVVILRELAGLMRLDEAQVLKSQAADAIAKNNDREARSVADRLSRRLATRPETAKGRATLEASRDDIIDPPHLIALAERELLAPLDRKARALILGSSKRVSVVTAVSPRAIVDLVYVLFEVVRLVRAMAELYGGRPGRLGMLRLLRDVIAHLAVTGSIAVGDGLAQQILGHGLASRLSARLGEGVINGLMTARIGIAAMDLCRPLPFVAVKRPGIGDFIGDLTPSMKGEKPDNRE